MKTLLKDVSVDGRLESTRNCHVGVLEVTQTLDSSRQ